jgi:hypothetical protein
MKKVILKVFWSPEARKRKIKIRQIHIFGFHCVAKHIEG